MNEYIEFGNSVILIVCPLSFLDEYRLHPLTLKASQCMETFVSVTITYTPYKISGHCCVDQTLLFFYQYIQFHIDVRHSNCPLGLIDGESSHLLILKTS